MEIKGRNVRDIYTDLLIDYAEKNHLENVTIELDYQDKLRFRVQ